jgi:hypothetical protein
MLCVRPLLASLCLCAAAASATADTVTIPSGRIMEVRMERALYSDQVIPDEPFFATVTLPLRIDGQLAIPAESRIEGRVTTVKSAGSSGVIGVRFVRLHLPDGVAYDIDGVLAPTQEGELLPVPPSKKKAVVLIGNESDAPGKRASTVVGNAGERPEDVADRWSGSGLSPRRASIAKGAEMVVELRKPLTVEAPDELLVDLESEP